VLADRLEQPDQDQNGESHHHREGADDRDLPDEDTDPEHGVGEQLAIRVSQNVRGLRGGRWRTCRVCAAGGRWG
jgi:hypothetical protein